VSAEGIVGKVGKFNICFRDVHLSSHAGMALLQGFIEQLGVAEVLDTELKVKQRERGYSESESVLGLAHNVILGGECLSDLKVVRGDPGTQHLIGADRFIAPTTAGEFLRKFDLGDIQDMRRVNKRLQARVRPKQQASCCTLDRDSSIDEQASKRKQGSTQTYTGEIGDHPLFAFWEEEEEDV
jgi:Transposase DDE domain group 1